MVEGKTPGMYGGQRRRVTPVALEGHESERRRDARTSLIDSRALIEESTYVVSASLPSNISLLALVWLKRSARHR